MSIDIEPPVAAMARAWARAVCAEPGSGASPQQLEPVLIEIIDRLLTLARSEPFPVPEARMLGARLAEAPFDRIRMLAQATRWLLGFPSGAPGSLVATRWPFVASQAIDSYAQALQERALAQQEQNLSAKVSLRVQEIAALQHRLRHEATHDALTDLANRTLLQDRVRLMSTDPNRGVGLLLIDLDRFKQINDQHGHLAGDMALREAAQRVDAHIRGSDAAARFGGDEFVVLAPGISPEQAAALAERIRLAVSETPLEIQPGVQLRMTVSIGVAGTTLARDEADLKAAAERLLADADSALYRAKQKGRNRVELA